MAKHSPQSNYFETSIKFSRLYNYVYWIIFILSIILTFFKQEYWIGCLSIFSIILLNILELISDNIKSKAEEIRRKDFIDNSFGTKLIHNSSDSYYDNEEVELGIIKVFHNLFENSFFSMRISEKMLKNNLLKNLLFAIVIVGLAIYGFSNSAISLPILQLYLSKFFIHNYIKLYIYFKRVEGIFDNLKLIAENLKNEKDLIESRTICELVKYEVNIAESNLLLDSKLYNQMNSQLTIEWEDIKSKYINKGEI